MLVICKGIYGINWFVSPLKKLLYYQFLSFNFLMNIYMTMQKFGVSKIKKK